MALIQSIRDMGITIVMVEHLVKAVFGMADRIVVLSAGELIAQGTPAEIACNQNVIDAYLGKSLMAEFLADTRRQRRLRGHPGLVGCVTGRRRRRDRRAHRAERGGQDDPDARDRRSSPAQVRHHPLGGQRPAHPAGLSHRRPGGDPGPRGTAALRRADRVRQPGAGRIFQAGERSAGRDVEARLRALPPAGRAARTSAPTP